MTHYSHQAELLIFRDKCTCGKRNPIFKLHYPLTRPHTVLSLLLIQKSEGVNLFIFLSALLARVLMACSQEVGQAASQSAMKPFNLLFKQEAQFGEVGELSANTFRWKHAFNVQLKQGTEILILSNLKWVEDSTFITGKANFTNWKYIISILTDFISKTKPSLPSYEDEIL